MRPLFLQHYRILRAYIHNSHKQSEPWPATQKNEGTMGDNLHTASENIIAAIWTVHLEVNAGETQTNKIVPLTFQQRGWTTEAQIELIFDYHSANISLPFVLSMVQSSAQGCWSKNVPGHDFLRKDFGLQIL